MLEMVAQLLESRGVKAPEKIETAIVNILTENNLTIAESKMILKSVKSRLDNSLVNLRGRD